MIKRKTPESAHADAELVDRLRPLLRKLDSAREQGRKLGLFVEDRELLACARCGLIEDVAIDGIWLVYRAGQPAVDSGLRFLELGDGIFRCPSCGGEIKL